MKRKTKLVHTTGDKLGYVVVVHNPAGLLRRDERNRVGGPITKSGKKAATVFRTRGAAVRAGNKYVKGSRGTFTVFAVGSDDKDHVTV